MNPDDIERLKKWSKEGAERHRKRPKREAPDRDPDLATELRVAFSEPLARRRAETEAKTKDRRGRIPKEHQGSTSEDIVPEIYYPADSKKADREGGAEGAAGRPKRKIQRRRNPKGKAKTRPANKPTAVPLPQKQPRRIWPKWGDWEASLPGVQPVVEQGDPWRVLLNVDPANASIMRSFSVGVDAGTSGVRVAAFEEFGQDLTLFDFGANLTGGTRFSLPSVAGVLDGRLVLGNDALTLPPERRFASFKARTLFPEQSKSVSSSWSSLSLPFAEAFSADRGPGAAEFLFVASVARSLEMACPELLGSFDDAYAYFTLGVPLNGRDELRRRRFERLFAAALALSGTVGPEPSLERLVPLFAGAWEVSREMVAVEEGERRFGLRAEAHATAGPLKRYLRNGENFLVADIGAASSEVSVFRVSPQGELIPYASRSLPIGVDLVDRRAEKEEAGQVDLVRRRADRKRPDHDESAFGRTGAVREVAGQLRTGLRSVLYLAAKNCTDQPGWRRMNVIVGGGGSNIGALRAVFERGLHELHPSIKEVVPHPVKSSSTFVVGASTEPVGAEEAAELVCVSGIAAPEEVPFREVDWSEVEKGSSYEDPLAELETWARGRWL